MSRTLEQIAQSACFHYCNCAQDCGKMDFAMAELAKACNYSDPAIDKEIEKALQDARYINRN